MLLGKTEISLIVHCIDVALLLVFTKFPGEYSDLTK